MPTIPDAASYVAPFGAGTQIGLGLARQQQERQQFLQSLAERQRESQFTEGLQGAQAARQAKEFQDTQDWQKGFESDFQSEIEKEAAKNKDLGLGPDVNNAFSQQTRTPQQIQNEVLSRWLPRAPAPVLYKLAPVMQRQVITPLEAARLAQGDRRLTNQEGRYSTLEEQGQERNDLRRASIKSGQMSQLRSLQTSTGEPIFDPETGEFDSEAYKRALAKAGTSFEFNKVMTPAEKQASNILQADPYWKGKSEDEIDAAKAQIVANGGKQFSLTPAQDSDIQKSNQITRGIEKLSDVIDAYKGDFGPMFTAKAAIGKYTGESEDKQKLQQIYNQISIGKAFDVGGKTLTPTELGAILSTIGSPTNPNFRERVKDYLQSEAEKHAQQIEVLKSGGYETNPKLRGQVNNYIENLKRISGNLAKSGRKLSVDYTGNGDSGANDNTESDKAKSFRSKYNY